MPFQILHLRASNIGIFFNELLKKDSTRQTKDPTKYFAEFNMVTVDDIHAFFYKSKLYKNTQAGNCPKIENKLRTTARLKF